MNRLFIPGFILLIFIMPGVFHAQNIKVKFSVDMSLWIDQRKFNPGQETVDIAGDFNNWGSPVAILSDANGDEIYQIEIDGFSANQAIKFKFRINGKWDGREEFPSGGPDRMYTVLNGMNELIYWYNDELPEGSDPVAKFETFYPTVLEHALVQFENASLGEYTQTKWIFEGGDPLESSEQLPLVRYRQAGDFDVTLIVGNGQTSDTANLDDYIHVMERDLQALNWWNDAVFYEIFVRSFYDSGNDGIGDIQGLIDKLDYLNDGDPETDDDLGITGIWLMPVQPSPSYHGYDVMDYRNINPEFGNMEIFRKFLDEAHKRGIRVIIDFVMNHSSSQHPWFLDAVNNPNSAERQYYRWSSSHPGTMGWHQAATGYYYGYFWSGMPDLNYESGDLKNKMFDIADFWLSDIGVDGFRLDAVKFIIEEGSVIENSPATIEFWKEYQTAIKNIREDAYSVGEAWTSTDQVVPYQSDGGLDNCFDFDLAFRIVDGVNGNYARDISAQIQRAYNVYPHLQFATFLRNHDLDRLKTNLGNSDARVKTAASILLTLPGTPYIYYGEEIGMTGARPEDIEVRTPMQWTAGSHAGFTSGSPWTAVKSNYLEYNAEVQSANDQSILAHYKNFIRLRNNNKALRRGSYHQVVSTNSGVLAFLREYEDQLLLVLISLSGVNASGVSLDMQYTDLESGQYLATDLISRNEQSLEISPDMAIANMTFQPREVKILELSKTVPTLETGFEYPGISIFPNPAFSELYINVPLLREGKVHYQILDTSGKLMLQGYLQSEKKININSFNSGLYFINITSDTYNKSLSFFIDH